MFKGEVLTGLNSLFFFIWKKMKRGILFQYLTECDVFVQVVADKKEIMNLVLSHWGSPVADHKDSRGTTSNLLNHLSSQHPSAASTKGVPPIDYGFLTNEFTEKIYK